LDCGWQGSLASGGQPSGIGPARRAPGGPRALELQPPISNWILPIGLGELAQFAKLAKLAQFAQPAQ